MNNEANNTEVKNIDFPISPAQRFFNALKTGAIEGLTLEQYMSMTRSEKKKALVRHGRPYFHPKTERSLPTLLEMKKEVESRSEKSDPNA